MTPSHATKSHHAHHSHHTHHTHEPKPYKPFNSAFKTLLRDLMAALPDVKELKMMFMGYKLAKTLSKKCVYQMWRDTLQTPYLDSIQRHDDAFAFQPSFRLPSTISPIYAALAPSIIAYWKDLAPDVKEMVWKHADNLISLCEKCQDYEAAKLKARQDQDSE